MPFNSMKAFTLIELLIVVAIIAILAAIAVPNFLEAQVRSKVSRTKSDMRTIATALESYYVDENKYPPDFTGFLLGANTNSPIFRDYNTLIGRLSHLTTPISYISSLPSDIFAEKIAAGGSTNYSGSALSSAPYREGGTTSGEVISPVVYDYATYDREFIGSGESAIAWERISSNPGVVQWALNSPGPDISVHEYLGNPDFELYDPTNGTVSVGQIVRTNLGFDDQAQ